MEDHQISAREFVDKYQNGELDRSQIIDVREPWEWELYHLDAASLIPMNSIPEQLQAIEKDKDAYIVCAHGIRSLHVTNYLLSQGLQHIINVEGGMAEIHYLLNHPDDF